MNHSPKQQKGLGLFGLIFVFAMIGFTALVVMRCWPVYLNQMKIEKAINNAAADPEVAAAQDSSPLSHKLEHFWDVDSIDSLDYHKVRLVREDRGMVIQYKYEARTPLFYNISLLFDFQGSVPVSGGGN